MSPAQWTAADDREMEHQRQTARTDAYAAPAERCASCNRRIEPGEARANCEGCGRPLCADCWWAWPLCTLCQGDE